MRRTIRRLIPLAVFCFGVAVCYAASELDLRQHSAAVE
jgi:hypothetical protein